MPHARHFPPRMQPARCLVAGLAAAWLLLNTAQAQPAAAAAPDRAATALAHQVMAQADAGGRPFAIVDKQAARMVVFHPDGRQAGSTAVLLGRDRGDGSAPGVGDRAQTGSLRPGDATTPAGRFDTHPGHNVTGEDVLWMDHAAALAVHRVRPGPGLASRLRRLATTGGADKRVTAGCVVVPVAFYEHVVRPVLGLRPVVVYVIPEDGNAQGLWQQRERGSL